MKPRSRNGRCSEHFLASHHIKGIFLLDFRLCCINNMSSSSSSLVCSDSASPLGGTGRCISPACTRATGQNVHKPIRCHHVTSQEQHQDPSVCFALAGKTNKQNVSRPVWSRNGGRWVSQAERRANDEANVLRRVSLRPLNGELSRGSSRLLRA